MRNLLSFSWARNLVISMETKCELPRSPEAATGLCAVSVFF